MSRTDETRKEVERSRGMDSDQDYPGHFPHDELGKEQVNEVNIQSRYKRTEVFTTRGIHTMGSGRSASCTYNLLQYSILVLTEFLSRHQGGNDDCYYDERLKSKTEGSTRLTYTGLLGGLEHLKIETR